MAKLCPTCKQKPQPPGTYRGTCHGKVSTDCKAWTEDFAFTLCEPCAEQLERCAWCLGPINGGWGVDVPTTKQFVRKFQNDNGSHTPGMEVGEQVLVQLMVDMYSGYTWQLNRSKSSREVSLYGFRLIRDPQNYRQGTLELYIDLNGAAEKAKIFLDETASGSRWWTPPPTGKTWECTVEISR